MRDSSYLKPSYCMVSVLLLLELPVIFLGCASGLKVEVIRDRGLGLDPYSIIAVGTIAGEVGPTFRDELSTALEEKGKFEVSSRRFNGVIPDSISIETAQNIGKETRASVFITGNLGVRYTKDRVWHSIVGTVQTDSGKWVIQHTWDATFRFRIIDLKRGIILLDHAMSNTQILGEDEDKNIVEAVLSGLAHGALEEKYRNDTRKEIINEFLRELTLYTEKIELKLRTDEELPELKEGVLLAHDQQWEKAAEIFKAVIEKYPDAVNIDKAYFDLGVVSEYSHRFDDAQEYLHTAVELNNEPDYENELQSCKIFEQEYYTRMDQSLKNENHQ
jgi:tetratricopeptide (TPR) repeat protein